MRFHVTLILQQKSTTPTIKNCFNHKVVTQESNKMKESNACPSHMLDHNITSANSGHINLIHKRIRWTTVTTVNGQI